MNKKLLLAFNKLNISQVITLVFIGVIFIGALILSLPISCTNGNSNGFLNALFTATSAACVTGLTMGDTYTQWSLLGQIIILILIQIGGLGFMSIASIFFFSLKKQIHMGSMMIMAQSLGTGNMQDVVRIQKKVIFGGLIIEGLGAIILTFRFCKDFSVLHSIWLGLFHSVSAFCNAGFDILGFISPGANLIIYQHDYIVLITIAVLIIIGGIGFVVWDDISLNPNPKKWNIYTKIVVTFSIALLIAGTILFCIWESNNPETMANFTVGEKILNSFFQSTTSRTAGFMSVDQGLLTEDSKILTLILMFIGGASGSTAGGLKVATFAIIIMFFISRLQGKENVNIFNRRIHESLIMNALCLFGMMTVMSVIGATIICGTTDFRFVEGLYETVSALATVGLSTGVISGIGVISKLLLIIYMFFGRVGILTISMGFLQKGRKKENYRYPNISIPIG